MFIIPIFLIPLSIPVLGIILMYILFLIDENDSKPPEGLHIGGYEGSNVRIRWNPRIYDDPLNKCFAITLWSEKNRIEHVANLNDQSISMPFSPNVRNYVTICVKNGSEHGENSEIFTFRGPNLETPSIEQLNVKQLGTSSLLVTWTRPTSISDKHLKGYWIKCYELNSERNSKEARFREIENSSRHTQSVKFSDLPQGFYCVSVATVGQFGVSKPSRVEITTNPYHVSSKPTVPDFSFEVTETSENYQIDMNLEEAQSSSDVIALYIDNEEDESGKRGKKKAVVKVTWLPSLNGNPGDRFSVNYRIKGRKEKNDGFRKIVEENEDHVTLENLKRGVVYEVGVTSMDGVFSTDSPVKEICLE